MLPAGRLQGEAVLGAQQPGLAHGRLQAGEGAVVDGALHGGQLQPAVLVHALRQVQLLTYKKSKPIAKQPGFVVLQGPHSRGGINS